jgi:hypothetical protein
MGEVQSPSTACYDAGLLVSTALAGFAGSEFQVWARNGFGRLCGIKCRAEACVTTQCFEHAYALCTHLKDVSTTMVSIHVLQCGERAVHSPLNPC